MAKKIVLCILGCRLLVASNIEMVQQVVYNGTAEDTLTTTLPHEISAHTYGIVTTVALCAYVGTTLYALRTRYLLNDMNAWNNWKNNMPLSDLASMPQKDVSQMLTKSIQAHYHCPPGTALMNIPQFLRDTCNEIDTLTRYRTIGTFLQSFYIAPLVCMTKDSMTQTEEKIKRLQFIQTIVANDLEPHDVIRRLALINQPRQTFQSWMLHALDRHQ